MKPILIAYATREGHTRRVAERVASTLAASGGQSELVDVETLAEPLDLGSYRAAVLAASVHVGHYEPEMVGFAKWYRSELAALPTAFIGVSLSEATVEDATAPPEKREEAARDVDRALDHFFTATGWQPSQFKPVAGALTYTHYGALQRFIVKLVAKRSGLSTDTSHDWEYTNFAELEQFVRDFESGISGAVRADVG
jgi:menaquinone-dependent protoporphyrinogen oxidase